MEQASGTVTYNFLIAPTTALEKGETFDEGLDIVNIDLFNCLETFMTRMKLLCQVTFVEES